VKSKQNIWNWTKRRSKKVIVCPIQYFPRN